jgi:SAM-dependent methyltransferase
MNNSEKTAIIREQYKDPANFNARVELHRLFSVNPQGWHHWVFEQFELPAQARLLEIGCGPGWLWLSNRAGIPSGWDITLTDFSSAMLETARQHLKFRPFTFQQADAQDLPFPNASFDAIIANHMLYHVPDKPRAFAEIRRVLKPGGKFYASTIGKDNMLELRQLNRKFGIVSPLNATLDFNLENGAEQLAGRFPNVELRLYEDELRVTEAGPAVAYAGSAGSLTEQQAADLQAAITQEIAAHGYFRISKPIGMFIATL